MKGVAYVTDAAKFLFFYLDLALTSLLIFTKMQSRGSLDLPGYNGTNVWYAPGTAINSTEAFHHASDLEEAAYLANRYMFIAMMVSTLR